MSLLIHRKRHTGHRKRHTWARKATENDTPAPENDPPFTDNDTPFTDNDTPGGVNNGQDINNLGNLSTSVNLLLNLLLNQRGGSSKKALPTNMHGGSFP
jgi:hypothetical protein